MIGNKIADKITKVPRSSPENSSETVESEIENIGLNRVLSEQRQEIIDKLRLI